MQISFNNRQFSIGRISAHQIIPENILLQGVSVTNPHLVQIEISPTDSCNQNCNWCFTVQDRFNGRSVKLAELRQYIDKFTSQGGCSIVFSGGGEPLIYKPIYKNNENFDGKSLILYCLDLGLACGIITNGVNSTAIQEGVDIKRLAFLRVSIDCLDRKMYTALHNCNKDHFYNLIENIECISKEKGHSPLPAFGISFIVDGDSGLNATEEDLEIIRRFTLDKNIDFVQFKHLHTSDKKQAEITMQALHDKLKKMYWKDTEFWVQKYLTPRPEKNCRVTEIIQSVGGENQRFPCCHLFGDSNHFPQDSFQPEGKVIENCNSRVCRYLSINDILNEIRYQDKYIEAEKKLVVSLEKYGFHPYRFFPTAPNLYFPVSSDKAAF
ncbi:radical SAM protein [Methylomonas sp. EFPC1]|uniref:radical SAM protein n=1 Tax=Methylomonas sp. EFPC1 TaxID=2812647 RepID=UPI001967607C|nr:radical SAM protein [Methylomonas sp. EFPC1]QSB02016.1 radical SAM protein [Methylomonas sp. EFPC1]